MDVNFYPVKAFQPRTYNCPRMLIDPLGQNWPMDAEEVMKRIRENTNSVNTMVGVDGDTRIIEITAKQSGILASFLPMNKSVPQHAISLMRAILNKLYEMTLDEPNDELMQNQKTSLL